MKVAFILPSLANKGPVLVVRELADNFAQRGVECSVYYFDAISEVEMPCRTERISMLQKVDFSSYDIIHCHLLRPDIFGFINSFRAGNRKKLVTTLHNFFWEDLSFSYPGIGKYIGKVLWQISWRRFNKIVVLSEVAKKYYYRYINRDKLTTIYNGREVQHLAIEEQDKLIFNAFRENGLTILGTIASFNARKGLEQIVKLLAINKKYAFVVVGDGPEKGELQSLARSLNVEERICFIGMRANGFRYNSSFDVFVIPSRSEGVPLALLEAVSLKVPVLCSDIDVFKELFTEEEVLFFKLDDIESMNHTLSSLPDQRELYISKAYKRYTDNYTSKAMADKYFELYTAMKKAANKEE